MITAIEIEQEYGVSADLVRNIVKRLQIGCQMKNGLISISPQDAEKIVFDYHARQESFAWKDVAKKFNVSPANKSFRKLINSILPHYILASGTYYPIIDVEDALSRMDYYHIRKYKDKCYYMEGSREDFYITN